MTNNLNSVIVEGTITKIEKVDKAVFFTICTKRHFRDMCGEIHEEASYFNIETYGKLAESCDEILKENTIVRVVGRLKSLTGDVCIVAEHIEAKPPTANKEK